MTHDEWIAEAQHRIAISEGSSLKMYRDSLGIPTIGIGHNLQANPGALAQIGVHDIQGILNGSVELTSAQEAALFALDFAPIESEARTSLDAKIFDALTDARRFVVCDLIFNMGPGSDGWGGFNETHALIAEAQRAKNAGLVEQAHALFVQIADHLRASGWYGQVGNRARRDVAMMQVGVWSNPNGDGSDIL